MEVFDFEIGSLWKDQASQISRRTVLFEISRGLDFGPLRVRPSLEKTLCLWRKMVYSLASEEVNWGIFIDKPYLLESLLNCRPDFAKVSPELGFCRWDHICPWCWSRRIREKFKRVSYVLKTHSEYQLITSRMVKYLPISADGSLTDLTRVYKAQRDARRDVIKEVSPGGAFTICTVEPYRSIGHDKKSRRWKVNTSLLLLKDRREKVPCWLLDDEGTDCVPFPETKDLVKGLARVLRYPKGLLLGSPFMVAEILQTKKNHRLEATYGSLRHKTRKR